jgi:hypothetical protein
VTFAVEAYGRLGLDAVVLLYGWAQDAASADGFAQDTFLPWIK